MSTFLDRTYRVWVPALFIISVFLMFTSAVLLAEGRYPLAAASGVAGFGTFMPMMGWLLRAAQREVEETKTKVTSLLIAYGVQPDRAAELLTKLQTEMRGITVR